jgi:hypothetical protein
LFYATGGRILAKALSFPSALTPDWPRPVIPRAWPTGQFRWHDGRHIDRPHHSARIVIV